MSVAAKGRHKTESLSERNPKRHIHTRYEPKYENKTNRQTDRQTLPLPKLGRNVSIPRKVKHAAAYVQ